MKAPALFSLLIILFSILADAGEYEKMFSCSLSLKNETQISTSAIAKNFVALPAKHKNVEGVNLFFQNGIYFCKLPGNFFVRNIDEKVYKMNLSVPKQKPIYMSYVKSTTEPSTIEAMNLEDSMQAKVKNVKLTYCTRLEEDQHSEKVFAEFLRSAISQVHEKFAGETGITMMSRSSVESLKLCEKSFLLKTVADSELRKFEVRVPANEKPIVPEEPTLNLDH